jgi:hypothetical protein
MNAVEQLVQDGLLGFFVGVVLSAMMTRFRRTTFIYIRPLANGMPAESDDDELEKID